MPNIVGASDIGGFSGTSSTPSGPFANYVLNTGATFSTTRSSTVNIETFTFNAAQTSSVWIDNAPVRPRSLSIAFIIKY